MCRRSTEREDCGLDKREIAVKWRYVISLTIISFAVGDNEAKLNTWVYYSRAVLAERDSHAKLSDVGITLSLYLVADVTHS